MKYLIVLADGGRAKILEKNGHGLKQIFDLVECEDLIGDYDIDKRKPGQSSADGKSHVFAPHTDPSDVQKSQFIKAIADKAQKMMGDFHAMILIAPPAALGELRKNIKDVSTIDHQVPKDLLQASDEIILAHIQKPYV